MSDTIRSLMPDDGLAVGMIVGGAGAIVAQGAAYALPFPELMIGYVTGGVFFGAGMHHFAPSEVDRDE